VDVPVIEQQNVYYADFGGVQERTAADRKWLRDLRDGGMAAFRRLGFPTTKHEEWRFTNVQPIASTPFVLADGQAAVAPGDAERAGFGGASAARLVFVDGRYRPQLSRVRAVPEGVKVSSLGQALAAGDPVVRQHLGRYARAEDDAFDALNTAFIEDGAFIHIGREATLDAPIHLLYISTASEQPQATHPRNLIIAEPGSSATVVENYISLTDGVYFANAVTEVVVTPNAQLHHYLLERDSEQAYSICTLRVHQDRDSQFESHTALLGGAIVRNNVHVELRGPGCHSLINGLYLPRGEQQHDNHMRIVHAAERCDSRQFYKGIINDQAKAVFSGRIIVRPEGQKTDAKQTNRNLLLSTQATANARPQLEIYADDVKCTHGATTGHLDEEALHYLRSRGIDKDTARGLLVYAFAQESLERMTVEPIRKTLERLMIERLPQSQLLRKFI
jgi:Fe-S cluster assembly protein SufD